MAGDAFLAGVKPGGLTDSTNIGILLCYLIKTAAPLQRQALDDALMEEQLVNYFELSGTLADLVDQGLIAQTPKGYVTTVKGANVADTLSYDLPRSVRESAIRAVIRAQSYLRKEAQHIAEIEHTRDGYIVHCSISDMGSEVFHLALMMPDLMTANLVKKHFVEDGSEVFRMLLTKLTEEPRPEKPGKSRR